MVKGIPTLTEREREIIRLKITEIVREILPEKIICYSLSNKIVSSWSCFANQPSTFSIDCHLLIIVKEKDRRKAGEFQDKVSGLSSFEIRICALIFGFESINDEQSKGGYFFRRLAHEGIVLFDSNGGAILPVTSFVDSSAAQEKAEAIWDRWWGLGENFLDSAIQDMDTQRTLAALFHLHQAAEHSLRALIQSLTGYRPATHSIPRLLELSKCLTTEIADIFPCNTEEEGELLSILGKGYVNARYELDFTIPFKTICILFLRIQRLRAVAEKVHDDITAFSKYNPPQQANL